MMQNTDSAINLGIATCNNSSLYFCKRYINPKPINTMLRTIVLMLLLTASTVFSQIMNPINVQIRDINNRPETLRRLSYEAKATVIIFFNQQCTVCTQYIKTLNELNSMFAPQGVNMYLAFPDSAADLEQLQVFAMQYKILIPIITDRKQELTNSLKATSTPQTFVLNNKGDILYNGRINNMFENLWLKRPKVTTQELTDALTATLKNTNVKVKSTDVVGCAIQLTK